MPFRRSEEDSSPVRFHVMKKGATVALGQHRMKKDGLMVDLDRSGTVESKLEVRVMPKLELTDEQVIELVKQLPPNQQEALFKFLLRRRWGTWGELSRYGQEGARRAAAECGRDWEAMTEEEREAFIDDLVHEDRGCSGYG